MKLGKILVSFVAWVILLGPGTTRADDTDVYFDPAGQQCGDGPDANNTIDPENGEFACVEPLVMLTLDLRSNAISSGNLCTFGGDANNDGEEDAGGDCANSLGEEITGDLLTLDKEYELGLAGSGITLFDAIRAVYGSVFLDLEGIKLGMMVSHGNSQGADDPGAYVLRGFRSMQPLDANGAKEELLRKMFSLPKPEDQGGPNNGPAPAGDPPPAPLPACDVDLEPHQFVQDGMTFSVSDILVNEGSSGQFVIEGSGANNSGANRSLSWKPVNDSALVDVDYTSASGSETVAKNKEPFASGKVKGQATVDVSAIADGEDPGDTERFKLELQITKTDTVKGKDVVTVLATMTAFAYICDVPAGTLTITDDEAYEGDTASFAVSLSLPEKADLTVDYQVRGVLGGADQADLDLGPLPYNGSVVIQQGKTTAMINVPVLKNIDGDELAEEDFQVEVVSTSNAAIVLPAAAATGTIKPAPQECAPNEISANDAHAYRGASAYFELFRYLTGGPVYLGHEGMIDFTGPDDKNLDQECYLPGYGEDYDYAADDAYAPNAGGRTPGLGILAWDLGGKKPLDPNNPPVEDNGNYVSPITDEQECAGIFGINMLFGVSNDQGFPEAEANKAADDGGVGPSDEEKVGNSDPFSDMLRLLADTDLGSPEYDNVNGGDNDLEGTQSVKSYIIRIVKEGEGAEKLVPPFCDGEQQGQAGGQFKSYCEDGKATVIPVSESDLLKLKEELENLFDSIISTSTTYVAASVPVNVFNRADINDNVFIALFSVDEEKRPYWFGNLKKLKVEQNGNSIKLVDANGADAVGPDGRIADNALTFWTKPAALPVPDLKPPVSPPDIDAGDDQLRKEVGIDGRIVTRGGAGQLIPGYTVDVDDPNRGNPGLNNADGPRRLFTNVDGVGDLQPLDADDDVLATEFAGLLGITDDAAKSYMCWMRGIGNCAAALGGAAPVARDWLFADAIHSRPLPLNYGAREGWDVENPDIRLLLGTNDGLFHMFQNTDANGGESGVENWAFLPPQHLLNAQRLGPDDNEPGNYPPHPYGVDGEPVVVVDPGADGVTIDHEDGDHAWVYFAMRRGGSAICALDISDPDNPASLWGNTCIDHTTPGFGELGLSFSNPVATRVKYGETSRPVLIFGGGYHGGWTDDSDDEDLIPDRVGYDNKDFDPEADPDAMKGNAIYIVDAETGALLWKAVDAEDAVLPGTAVEFLEEGLSDSIAAEISVVESVGIATRAYVGDMGGNVWRVDIPANIAYDEADPDTQDNRGSWSVRKVAALGGEGEEDRRFFHRIDIVFGIDPEGGVNSGFDALLIGSGNREWPKSTAVQDYMFMIKDNGAGTVAIDDLAHADCFLAEEDRPGGGVCNDVAESLSNGWKMPLLDDGEKMLGTSLTIGGRTYFSTYLPLGGKPQKCGGNEGSGRFYAVSLFNARPVENRNLKDDGGNPEPSTLVDRYCDDCLPPGIPPPELVPLGTDKFLLGLQPVSSGISNRYRTHWYEKDVD